MNHRLPALGGAVVPSSEVKPSSFAARLAAITALVSHALAIAALCACSMAAPAGPISSCHEQAGGLTLSSLDACCCEGQPGEARNRDFAMSLSPDATSFPTAAPSIGYPLSPVTGSEYRLRPVSHQGPTTPRPPLRV